MKTCVKCGRIATSKWYSGPTCRVCYRKRPKYYLKKKQAERLYYDTKGFGSRLKREYWPNFTQGQAIEEYNRLLILQNCVCAICKKPESIVEPRSKKPKRLCVDHCHKTGQVRGLLCHNCNRAVGLLKDDVTIVDNIRAYLNA
jgi:hypothetical protein